MRAVGTAGRRGSCPEAMPSVTADARTAGGAAAFAGRRSSRLVIAATLAVGSMVASTGPVGADTASSLVVDTSGKLTASASSAIDQQLQQIRSTTGVEVRFLLVPGGKDGTDIDEQLDRAHVVPASRHIVALLDTSQRRSEVASAGLALPPAAVSDQLRRAIDPRLQAGDAVEAALAGVQAARDVLGISGPAAAPAVVDRPSETNGWTLVAIGTGIAGTLLTLRWRRQRAQHTVLTYRTGSGWDHAPPERKALPPAPEHEEGGGASGAW